MILNINPIPPNHESYRRPTPEESRVLPWFAIKGDKTLRINYPLTTNSVVYDVGGYLGEWAKPIYEKYKCRIEVFEPVRVFYEKLVEEFKGKEKIQIHDFGLDDRNHTATISLEDASSSTFKSATSSEKIKLSKASEFIKNKNEKHIDLIKINIEGSEYGLLDDLITSGFIKNIDNIQVQFHIFVPDATKKRTTIQKRLSETHELTYSYPWIWENWRRKG